MGLPFANRKDLAALTADVDALRQQLQSILSSVGTITGQNDTLLRLLEQLVLDENRTDFLYQQLTGGNASVSAAFLAQVRKDCAEFRTAIDACIVLNNSLEGEKAKIANAVKKSLPIVKSKVARALGSIAEYKLQVEASLAEKKVAPEVAQKYQANFARLASNIELLSSRLSSLEAVLNQVAAEIAKIELKDNPAEDKNALREAESNAKEGTESKAYTALTSVAAKLVGYRSFGDTVHSELSRISGVASQAYNELSFIERSIVSLRGEVAAILVSIHRSKVTTADSERIINEFKLKLVAVRGKLQACIDLRAQLTKKQRPDAVASNFFSVMNSTASRAFLERMEAHLNQMQSVVRDCGYLLPSVRNRLYLAHLKSETAYEQMAQEVRWLINAEHILSDLANLLPTILSGIKEVRPELGQYSYVRGNAHAIELGDRFFRNLGSLSSPLKNFSELREALSGLK